MIHPITITITIASIIVIIMLIIVMNIIISAGQVTPPDAWAALPRRPARTLLAFAEGATKALAPILHVSITSIV